MPSDGMLRHGGCAARDGAGVLLLGPPGAGKSDLLLRLVAAGWSLVADDAVLLRAEGGALIAAAPDRLRGMLELRGLGLVSGFPAAVAPIHLAADLLPREEMPRLPHPARFEALGVSIPRIALHAPDASAPARLGVALDVLAGRLVCTAGALEPAS